VMEVNIVGIVPRTIRYAARLGNAPYGSRVFAGLKARTTKKMLFCHCETTLSRRGNLSFLWQIVIDKKINLFMIVYN